MQEVSWAQTIIAFLRDFAAPAVLIILSGIFSIWGLFVRGKQKRLDAEYDAQREARKLAAEAQQAAREAEEREQALKDRALRKAEEALEQERRESKQLIADKIHHLGTKLQVYENQIGIFKMKSDKDEMQIKHLEETVHDLQEKLDALKHQLADSHSEFANVNREKERLRTRVAELERDLNDYRGRHEVSEPPAQ